MRSTSCRQFSSRARRRHVSRGVHVGKIHAHERFIGEDAAVFVSIMGSEGEVTKLLVDETAELLMAASFLQAGAVDLRVGMSSFALAGAVDLIHGEVRVYLRSVMRFIALLSGYHAIPPETHTRSSRPLGSWTTECSRAAFSARMSAPAYPDRCSRRRVH